jgi:hypothetical protein
MWTSVMASCLLPRMLWVMALVKFHSGTLQDWKLVPIFCLGLPEGKTEKLSALVRVVKCQKQKFNFHFHFQQSVRTHLKWWWGLVCSLERIMSWLCFLVKLVKIVATQKIMADQNFECATTKNRDSARKIAPIHHDISPVFLGGIQKLLQCWHHRYVDINSMDCLVASWQDSFSLSVQCANMSSAALDGAVNRFTPPARPQLYKTSPRLKWALCHLPQLYSFSKCGLRI